jgi:hypothetical protein
LISTTLSYLTTKSLAHWLVKLFLIYVTLPSCFADKSNTSSNNAAPSSFQPEAAQSQNHANSQTSLAKSENSIDHDNMETSRSNIASIQSKASSILSQPQQSSQSSGSSKIPLVKSKVTESEMEIEASSKQVEKLLIKDLKTQEGSEEAISNNKDHPSGISPKLPNSTESSNKAWDGPDKNFSLGLPRIKRKKFPYYKFGLISPKCKSIIDETQRKKKEKCLDGPWSNVYE